MSAPATPSGEAVEVRWTKELLADLLPVRGKAKSPRAKPVDLTKALERASSLQRLDVEDLRAVRRGTAKGRRALELEALAAGAAYEAEDSWPKRAKLTSPLVDRWVTERGLADAVEILAYLRSHGGRWSDFGNPYIFSAGDHRFASRVREWAAAAEADAWMEARARAVEVLARIDHEEDHGSLAVAYAYIFPNGDNPFLEEAAAASKGWAGELYQSVVNDEQLALLETRGVAWNGTHGAWFAEVFGAGGYERLRRIVSERDKEYFLACLPYVGLAPAQDVAERVAARDTARRVTEYFLAAPELAERVLPSVIEGGDKDARKAAERLLAQIRGRGAAPSDAAPKKVADVSALPTVLASPPWRSKKRPWAFTGPFEAVAPPVVCPEGTGELPTDAKVRQMGGKNIVLESPPGHYQINFSWVKDKKRTLPPADSVAVFGAAALPGLLEAVPAHMKSGDTDIYPWYIGDYFEQWLSIGAADFTPFAVALFARKDHHAFARKWLLSFPTHAMAGLGPMLHETKASKSRDAAHRVLIFLVEAIGEGQATKLATEVGYGDALAKWLALDPLERTPAKASSIPKFVQAPPLQTKDGSALSTQQLDAVIEIASFGIDWEYIGARQVRESLDPSSLDELAKYLVLAWIGAGSKSPNAWLVDALALYGSPTIVPWTKAQLRERLTAKDKNGALTILKQLIEIDRPSARLEVVRQLHHGRAAWLRRGVEELLEAHLKRHDLTLTEYEEGAIPPMPTTLALAGTEYRLRLDAELAPILVDAKGERIRRVPASASEAEVARWNETKSDAADLAKLDILRLERLLVDGAEFERERFDAMLAHPVTAALCERLVFAAGGSIFRVAEDHSLADGADKAYTLPAEARVRLAHPTEMSPEERQNWATILGDYEVIQPFPQIARTIVAEPPTGDVQELGSWEGREIHGGLAMSLGRRGWAFDANADGVVALHRDFASLDGEPIRVALTFGGTLYPAEAAKERIPMSKVILSEPAKQLTQRSAFEVTYAVESILTS